MELASALLPRIAPEIMAPRAVREGPEGPRLLQVDETSLATTLVNEVATRLDGDRSIGVVVADADVDSARAALIEAGLEPGDILSDGLNRQVTVLSADQSKGLEFDHVGRPRSGRHCRPGGGLGVCVHRAHARDSHAVGALPHPRAVRVAIARAEPEPEPEIDASALADASARRCP